MPPQSGPLRRLRHRWQQAGNRTGYRRYGVNALWMMVERIVRMLAWLVVGAAVVRYLGADRFGLLSYAQRSVGRKVVPGGS